jgi:hypothetical protein
MKEVDDMESATDAVHAAALEVGLVRPGDRYAWYASMARLAPSKHNTQPWSFCVSADALDVWADPARRLPATDLLGREMVLACGAAAQIAVISAAAIGVRLTVHPWPDGPRGPVARLIETERVAAPVDSAARLTAVRTRRTDRGPLDAGALPTSLPFVLQDVAAAHGCTFRLVTSEGDRSNLARLVELADRQLARTPEVDQEKREWLRAPGDPSLDGIPATSTRGMSASYSAPFVQRDFSLPQVEAAHERPGVDDPLVGVLCTPLDASVNWLQGGRALMDVLIETAVVGGSASYLNQPLELSRLRDVLMNDLDLPGAPQVVLRIGRGGAVEATPRRAVPDVVNRVP